MKEFVIVSLRAQANGIKQRTIKSKGRFKTFEEADVVASAMNETQERIYTTYMAVATFSPEEKDNA